MAIHPEAIQDNGFEPTVGEELRLAQFLNGLDRANESELREISKAMARQILVVYPSAMRWLAREAAQNLQGVHWGKEASDQLLHALSCDGSGGDDTADCSTM